MSARINLDADAGNILGLNRLGEARPGQEMDRYVASLFVAMKKYPQAGRDVEAEE